MKKLYIFLALSLLFVSGIKVARAYSDQTSACIDRVNGQILTMVPKYNASSLGIDQYIQQDIASFCLKYNPVSSTASNTEYENLDSGAKAIWNLFENYAAIVIFDEEALNLLMGENNIKPYMLIPASWKQSILDDMRAKITVLSSAKSTYQGDLSPSIDSCSGSPLCFATLVNNLIDIQYDSFQDFAKKISDDFAKNYLCVPHTLNQCNCFEGYSWDDSHSTCALFSCEKMLGDHSYTDENGVCQCEAGYEVGKGGCLQTTQQVKQEASPFSDVATKNVYFDAIKYLKDNNIAGGYGDGSFKPYNTINRAEFTKIVVGTITANPEGSKCFSDVTDQWFAPYVCYAKSNAVIGGYKDKTFKPNNNINLAEALKIIFLAMKVQLSTDTGSNWYDVYVNTANNISLLIDINTDISHNLTRGEMADLIYKLKTLN
jgi:hypothetical protein